MLHKLLRGGIVNSFFEILQIHAGNVLVITSVCETLVPFVRASPKLARNILQDPRLSSLLVATKLQFDRCSDVLRVCQENENNMEDESEDESEDAYQTNHKESDSEELNLQNSEELHSRGPGAIKLAKDMLLVLKYASCLRCDVRFMNIVSAESKTSTSDSWILYAHSPLLVARCPQLLTMFKDSSVVVDLSGFKQEATLLSQSGDAIQIEDDIEIFARNLLPAESNKLVLSIGVGHIFSRPVLRAILEFVYTGSVQSTLERWESQEISAYSGNQNKSTSGRENRGFSDATNAKDAMNRDSHLESVWEDRVPINTEGGSLTEEQWEGEAIESLMIKLLEGAVKLDLVYLQRECEEWLVKRISHATVVDWYKYGRDLRLKVLVCGCAEYIHKYSTELNISEEFLVLLQSW